jgi:hypothetical protein
LRFKPFGKTGFELAHHRGKSDLAMEEKKGVSLTDRSRRRQKDGQDFWPAICGIINYLFTPINTSAPTILEYLIYTSIKLNKVTFLGYPGNMPKDAVYKLTLSEDERSHLKDLLKQKVLASKKRMHAQVLLKSDQGEFNADGKWIDSRIAAAFDISMKTVGTIRKTAVLEGLEIALERPREPRPHKRKLDGAAEAILIAESCSPPPEGRTKWSLTMLCDRLVELEVVESIAPETVRATLKKNEIKPWLKKFWCIPKEKSGDYVAAMEDVLEVYQRPRDEDYPLVCLDEASKQHAKEVREPIRDSKGVLLEDSEYIRNGTSNIFMIVAPLEGWRKVSVTDHRKKVDWAHEIKDLVDIHFPKAKKIILVQDNLNTHFVGSLYQMRLKGWLIRSSFITPLNTVVG